MSLRLLARWFRDVNLHVLFWHLLSPRSLWPSAIAHCFKVLGSVAVLGSDCLAFILLNISAEMYAGSLASGC